MDSLIFTPADIDKILDSLEEHINKIDKFNNNYDFRIYNEFLSYFSTLDEIDFHKLAISSTYIFGTMPTTSAINSEHFYFAQRILNNNRRNFKELEDNEYLTLVKCMNNSVIATSKLLHLIYPKSYPAINGRIKNYFKSNGLLETVYKKTYSKEKEIQQYKLYRNICTEIILSERFTHNLHFQALRKMDENFGYSHYKLLEQIFYYFGKNI